MKKEKKTNRKKDEIYFKKQNMNIRLRPLWVSTA